MHAILRYVDCPSFVTHRSMQIFNADSVVVFSFEANQKRGQYGISKIFELL